MDDVAYAKQLVKSGDIIGQSMQHASNNFASVAGIVEKVTNSQFSHVGVIFVTPNFFRKQDVYVVQIVASRGLEMITFEKFVAQTKNKFSIYRYKEGISQEQISTMLRTYRGLQKRWWQFWKTKVGYDFALSADNGDLYCSELVDLLFKAVGISLSDNFLSIRDLEKNAESALKKGFFDKKYKSSKEVLKALYGPRGFYYKLDPRSVDKDAKTIISPEDVLRNENTEIVFECMH